MELKEAKEILDACAKHDVLRYKEAQRVYAEAHKDGVEQEVKTKEE